MELFSVGHSNCELACWFVCGEATQSMTVSSQSQVSIKALEGVIIAIAMPDLGRANSVKMCINLVKIGTITSVESAKN